MNQQNDGIKGLDLARRFFEQVARPAMEEHCPEILQEAACGLMGQGSECFGFDDQYSRDHHWGPRVMLFLLPGDYESKRESIHDILSQQLPLSYRSYSTNFTKPDPQDNGVQKMQPIGAGPVNHRVEILTIKGFFSEYLNLDIEKPIDSIDWLTLPHQKLRGITAGRVFRDDISLIM